MRTYTRLNGYSCEYDDTLKIGDLITSQCNKGFHRLVNIKDRFYDDQVPFFTFVKVYDEYGKPVKSKREYQCDSAYCRRAKESISSLIARYELAIIDLKNIRD